MEIINQMLQNQAQPGVPVNSPPINTHDQIPAEDDTFANMLIDHGV